MPEGQLAYNNEDGQDLIRSQQDCLSELTKYQGDGAERRIVIVIATAMIIMGRRGSGSKHGQ